MSQGFQILGSCQMQYQNHVQNPPNQPTTPCQPPLKERYVILLKRTISDTKREDT